MAPFFSVVPAKIHVFVVAWEKLFCPLTMEVRVQCYRQSYHKCCPLAFIFKCVVAVILLQRWKYIGLHHNLLTKDSLKLSQFCGFSSNEFISHVVLFSDWSRNWQIEVVSPPI
jgi:hypothetical protein